MRRGTPGNVHECECAICQAGDVGETAQRHRQINLFLSQLTEPQRRWFVGFLSQDASQPSDRELALITGLDPKTIRRGRRELENETLEATADRQRRQGGGAPSAEKKTRSW
jgi:hypothetical protein